MKSWTTFVPITADRKNSHLKSRCKVLVCVCVSGGMKIYSKQVFFKVRRETKQATTTFTVVLTQRLTALCSLGKIDGAAGWHVASLQMFSPR